MRAGIALGMVLGMIAGCSDSHARVADGGTLGDALPPAHCHPMEVPPPDDYCVYVGADHVCGDALMSPQCVAGEWQCAPGTSSDLSQCWCSGFGGGASGCVCTPSGWSCPTEPVDAGMATFACGDALSCLRGSQYCRHVLSDVLGQPDGYVCSELPEDCGDDCSCLPDAPGSGACVDDHAGGITVTVGGG